MTELRFHRDLYDAHAVDEAAKTFERYATIERAEEPACWIVRVTSENPAREQRVAGELANFALGLTIRKSTAAGVSR